MVLYIVVIVLILWPQVILTEPPTYLITESFNSGENCDDTNTFIGWSIYKAETCFQDGENSFYLKVHSNTYESILYRGTTECNTKFPKEEEIYELDTCIVGYGESQITRVSTSLQVPGLRGYALTATQYGGANGCLKSDVVLYRYIVSNTCFSSGHGHDGYNSYITTCNSTTAIHTYFSGELCTASVVEMNSIGLPYCGGDYLEECLGSPQCSAGYYISNTSSTGCRACPQGFFSPFANSTYCSACPGGFTSELSLGSTLCIPCLPGFTSEDGKCKACPVGTYSSRAAEMTCTPCDCNSYAEFSGSTYCTSCPPGTYAHAESSKCIHCPEGKISNGKTGCVSCPSGSIPSTSKDYCIVCSANTYAKYDGKECMKCPKDHESPPGSFSCYVK